MIMKIASIKTLDSHTKSTEFVFCYTCMCRWTLWSNHPYLCLDPKKFTSVNTKKKKKKIYPVIITFLLFVNLLPIIDKIVNGTMTRM